MTMPMVLLNSWSGQIAAAWNKSRENVIEVGRLLIKAKAELPHGLFTKMVETELPFCDRTAQMLMVVAGDERLSNPNRGAHLPQSWRTLYELTKLDDGTFDAGIERAVIRPDMERGDLRDLRPAPEIRRGVVQNQNEPEGAHVIKFAKPQVGDAEIAAVTAALGRDRLTNGGNVQAFEQKFSEMIGGGIAVATSSCTSALHMALLALGIGRSDEVIVPALSFAACAHVVEAVGAVPVFADNHPEAGQLDPEAVEPLVTARTRAIMLMHFAGRPGYLGTMKAVARRHNLRIIEDCATALGATHSGKHVGLHGDIGCFSFHPVKHITTCEGGMLVTTNPEFAERARALREFGKFQEIGAHSYVDYEIRGFGLNFRMTEMQGAMGCVQLDDAPRRLEIRRSNYHKLATAFRDMGLTVLDLNGESAAYCLIAHMPINRSVRKVRQALAQRLIETSVYYPGPLPMMPHYRGRYQRGAFPHAESIAQTTIAFSVGPHLGSADMAHTAETLKEILQ